MHDVREIVPIKYADDGDHIEVEIKDYHIDIGKPRSAQCCPIAMAFLDAFEWKSDKVFVYPVGYVETHDWGPEMDIQITRYNPIDEMEGDAVRKFIRQFDREQPVQPERFTFEKETRS